MIVERNSHKVLSFTCGEGTMTLRAYMTLRAFSACGDFGFLTHEGRAGFIRLLKELWVRGWCEA